MSIKILKAAMFTPMSLDLRGEVVWGLPLCFWGPPGVGKTFQMSRLAREFHLPLEVLSPGERGEGAFGVTPVPQGKVLTYPAPDWVTDLEDGGVLFLDEINQAPPPLQPALMGILLARRIGGHALGNRVRPIAAANPTEQAAGGWDFAPPVANRMGHLNWPDVRAEGWAEWLLGGDEVKNDQQQAETEEARVMSAWDAPWATARGLFAGFIKARPELLHKMPQIGNPDLGRAWPSPRTWDMACRAYASAQVHNLATRDREEYVAAFVGQGAANELFAYADKMDLPNPAELLDGKITFKHDPKRLDRTAAVLSSCHALVTPEKADKRKERAAKLWEIIGQPEIVDKAPDVAYMAAKAMVTAKPALHAMKAAYSVMAKMLPMLDAAGIKYTGNEDVD